MLLNACFKYEVLSLWGHLTGGSSWGGLITRTWTKELHFFVSFISFVSLYPTCPTPPISGCQTDAKNAKRTCKRVTIVSRHAKLERQSLSKKDLGHEQQTRRALLELGKQETSRRQLHINIHIIYIYNHVCICTYIYILCIYVYI